MSVSVALQVILQIIEAVPTVSEWITSQSKINGLEEHELEIAKDKANERRQALHKRVRDTP